MSSRQPAAVNLCLDEFARHGGLTATHKDGWGVAYYAEDGAVRLYKEPEPASRSDWVQFIEQRRIRSTAVLSHIRRATQGARSLKNTQPFRRELGGAFHVFAHNGDLPDLEAVPELEIGFHRPVGETDSEYAFCALLNQLHDLWMPASDPPALGQRFAVVSRFARTVAPLGMANFVYSDGDAVFAHGNRRQNAEGEEPRPPGLFVLHRDCASSRSEFCAKGLLISSDIQSQVMTLVASVPLTSEAWQPLGEGETVALRGGEIVSRTV